MIDQLSKMVRRINSKEVFIAQPPSGPPDEYPALSERELESISREMVGGAKGESRFAYRSLKLFESPEPRDVDLPTESSLRGMSIWGIDGSTQSVDYPSFHILMCRAATVEYAYSNKILPKHHSVGIRDCSALCLVDGNVFDQTVHLFGSSTRGLVNDEDTSWIDVIDATDDPLIVRYDSVKEAKKPSMHARGWAVKLMQTLELLSLWSIPRDSAGVVIRDGPVFSTNTTARDTYRALMETSSWHDKILVGCSKRIAESTLFTELLSNEQSDDLVQFYFPDQNIGTAQIRALSADYLLLPRILKPGQRTPLIEAVPQNRPKLASDHPEFIPLCCYYMRRRAPNTIIRIEIPRVFQDMDPVMVEWAISAVAWQHEIGVQVPHVQEAADMQCDLKADASIIKRITDHELNRRGMNELEVYE